MQSDKQRRKPFPEDVEAQPQVVDRNDFVHSSGLLAKYLLDPQVLPEELSEYRRSVL